MRLTTYLLKFYASDSLYRRSKLKSSLYSWYYVEACNEWWGSSPRLSVWATQLRRSRWPAVGKTVSDLSRPVIKPEPSCTDSYVLSFTPICHFVNFISFHQGYANVESLVSELFAVWNRFLFRQFSIRRSVTNRISSLAFGFPRTNEVPSSSIACACNVPVLGHFRLQVALVTFHFFL